MINRQLAEIAASVFKVSVTDLTPQTAVGSIEVWDSLGHLRLMLEIEEAFKVRFETEKIPKLTSLEKIQSELEKRGCLASESQRSDKQPKAPF